MKPLEENLYDGASNTVDFVFTDSKDVVIPFLQNGVTLMELYIGGQKLTSANNDISWDDKGGVKINSKNAGGIAKGVDHSVSLMVYDGQHLEPDNGQLFMNVEMPFSSATIKVTNPKL